MDRYKHCHVCKKLIGPAQTKYVATREEATEAGMRTVKEPTCPDCHKELTKKLEGGGA